MQGEATMGGAYAKRIGRGIKACRSLGQVSQDELAQRVGLAGGAVISAYEAGDKTPTLERAMAMAHTLGVSLSQLVGEHPASPLPAHVVNNANGDHQTVYMNVEGAQVLMDELVKLLREIVRQELAEGRERFLEDVRRLLQEGASQDRADSGKR